METRSGSNLRPEEETFEDEDSRSDTSVQVLTEEAKAQQRQAAIIIQTLQRRRQTTTMVANKVVKGYNNGTAISDEDEEWRKIINITPVQ